MAQQNRQDRGEYRNGPTYAPGREQWPGSRYDRDRDRGEDRYDWERDRPSYSDRSRASGQSMHDWQDDDDRDDAGRDSIYRGEDRYASGRGQYRGSGWESGYGNGGQGGFRSSWQGGYHESDWSPWRGQRFGGSQQYREHRNQYRPGSADTFSRGGEYGRASERGGTAWSGSMGTNRGGHAGKGPKNYKRTDERIQEEVSDRLTDDDMLDASEITVQVRDGDVMLSGTVSTREDKRRAEDLIENCSGVKEVTNNLRITHQDQTAGGNRTGARAGGL